MQKPEAAAKAALAAGAVSLGSRSRFDSLGLRARRKGAPRLHAGLGGWLTWELVDRNGRVKRGGEQHNLFLDQGLNAIATSPLVPDSNSGIGDWFTHACVGTGASAPSEADTELGSELARTATTLSTSLERPSNGRYVMSKTWSFGFGQGNGNLTEWGIARAASGQLIVRELIRDSNGTPVVISKTSDFELRLTYTFEVQLSPVTPTAHDVVIAGLNGGDPINGTISFLGGGVGNGATSTIVVEYDLKTFAYVAAGVTGSFSGRTDAGRPFISDSVVSGYTASNANAANAMGTRSSSAFTPGVWERSVSAVYGTGVGNFTIAAIGIVGAGQVGTDRRAGFVFNIDAGDRPTKDNEHILTIDNLLTVTWGRD